MIWYWVYGALALLSLVHLAVFAYVYRSGKPPEPDGEGAERHVDGVKCPECGVRNEQGYRYCRVCVSELPGHLSVENRSASPRSRGML